MQAGAQCLPTAMNIGRSILRPANRQLVPAVHGSWNWTGRFSLFTQQSILLSTYSNSICLTFRRGHCGQAHVSRAIRIFGRALDATQDVEDPASAPGVAPPVGQRIRTARGRKAVRR